MSTYVLRETNIPGAKRLEVDAYEVEARMEFHSFDANPGSPPTIMSLEEFHDLYEAGTTPEHARHTTVVSAPPMV